MSTGPNETSMAAMVDRLAAAGPKAGESLNTPLDGGVADKVAYERAVLARKEARLHEGSGA